MSKKKVLIISILTLTILAIIAVALFITKPWVGEDDFSVTLTAEDLAPYLPDYSIEEIEAIMNSDEERELKVDSIEEIKDDPTYIPFDYVMLEDDNPDDNEIPIMDVFGNEYIMVLPDYSQYTDEEIEEHTQAVLNGEAYGTEVYNPSQEYLEDVYNDSDDSDASPDSMPPGAVLNGAPDVITDPDNIQNNETSAEDSSDIEFYTGGNN